MPNTIPPLGEQDPPRKKWREFEKFVASIQKQLAPQATVQHDVKIKGKTGIDRQVDISIRFNMGQFSFLGILDCKDWKTPVDIKTVEEFIGLVEDTGANKGAIVCNASFTDAAKTKATQRGIDLFSALDAQSTEWPAKLAIPILCDFRGMSRYLFIFRDCAPTPMPFMMPAIDPRYLEIYRQNGEQIDLLTNLLSKLWNAGKLPVDPGEHRELAISNEVLFVKVNDILYGPVEIKAHIFVEQRLYFGHLPLVEARGLRNEISGAFTTKSITTDLLDIVQVEKSWRRIQAPDELAIKPVFELVASDQHPLLQNPV